MKAQQYADLYNGMRISIGQAKAEADIAEAFIREMMAASEKRKCLKNRAYLALVKEFNEKWNKFMKLTGVDTKYDFVVEIFLPPFYAALKKGPGVFEELGWN